MNNDNEPLNLKLLERTACLRALALRLVRDETLAEDLVQDTWRALLKKPPAERRSEGSWVVRVLRNLSFRSYQEGQRRRRRETAVARPEQVDTDPQQLVERAEAHCRLVDAGRASRAMILNPWEIFNGRLYENISDPVAPVRLDPGVGI